MSDSNKRYVKKYPVPPVCTANWTEADWERTAVIVDTEPDKLTSCFGTWVKTGRCNDKGEMLYTLEEQ